MGDLLATVGEPERTRVLEACRPRKYARGTILFHEGEAGDGLHIVDSGHLVVRTGLASGDVVTLDVAGPGDVIGEVALVLPDNVRSATVAALDDCTTLMLSVPAFRALCEENPAVATAVARVLAERVDRLTKQLSEALYVGVDQRVARRTIRMAGIYGGMVRGTEVPLTQQDLADLTGATRPTVNQSLKKLEAAGAVELFRGGVRVADPAALRRLAGL